jgi:CheY-like chemotaxis protein
MKSSYIIFADDDADYLELITGYFKQFNNGVAVYIFKSGKEVLKFLENVDGNILPLLIVSNKNMPLISGGDILVAVRSHPFFKNVPVVLYNTSFTKSDEDFCDNLGASWVLKSTSVEGVKQTAKILAEFCQLQHH